MHLSVNQHCRQSSSICRCAAEQNYLFILTPSSSSLYVLLVVLCTAMFIYLGERVYLYVCGNVSEYVHVHALFECL